MPSLAFDEFAVLNKANRIVAGQGRRVTIWAGEEFLLELLAGEQIQFSSVNGTKARVAFSPRLSRVTRFQQ